ncbi:hypothetical protein [Anabaena sp. CCY 9402-a]
MKRSIPVSIVSFIHLYSSIYYRSIQLQLHEGITHGMVFSSALSATE